MSSPRSRSRLRPVPEPRRRTGQRFTQRSTSPRIADLWPLAHAVVTWTCASAGVAVSALRGAVTAHARARAWLHRERVPRHDHAGPTGRRRPADARRPTSSSSSSATGGIGRARVPHAGPHCARAATTTSSSRRHRACTGTSSTTWCGSPDSSTRTPLLKFMQKGQGRHQPHRRKALRGQVLSAVSGAMAELGLTPRFVMMLADEEAAKYRLYVEPDAAPGVGADRLARDVDARSREAERRIRRQARERTARPARRAWLQAGDRRGLQAPCVADGQREGQFKSVALAYRRSFGLRP